MCLLFLLGGCAASTQIGNTRSSIEQRLLVRSFERALDRLDIHEFKDKSITVDFYAYVRQGFHEGIFMARSQGQQVRIATDPKQAQLTPKVLAPVIAVDQGQSFVGAPVQSRNDQHVRRDEHCRHNHGSENSEGIPLIDLSRTSLWAHSVYSRQLSSP